jgi:ubiquinone biosynthesis protein
MWHEAKNALRLARAAYVLAQYEALFPLELMRERPFWLRCLATEARWITRFTSPLMRRRSKQASPALRLSSALIALGPAYVKLGQFFATRPDIIGPVLANDLKALQDKLPPFSLAEAHAVLDAELGSKASALHIGMGEAVAAASIAQVHAITMPIAGDASEKFAVKILRPGVETLIAQELESFFWFARLLEKHVPQSRRLRPLAAVQTLADSLVMEMDLRLEAAAMEEMSAASGEDREFAVPRVIWDFTARRVLTCGWADGIPASDRPALIAAGHNMPALATRLIQIFLKHALKDGFFHGDMHPGNLFVDRSGRFIAVDFGIMGRLDRPTRRFLAEVLLGFIRRDYQHVARVHFEAGFVPAEKSIHQFAQALRAVGEPILGRPADEISMARLLAQLFDVTAQFCMPLQPQLLLLQKTMVVVEGVARDFDPHVNIWKSAEPVLKNFMQEKLAPEARLAEAAEGALALGRMMSNLPGLLQRAEESARVFQEMLAEGGVKLHPHTTQLLAQENARRLRHTRLALWLAIAALCLVALQLLLA